MIFLASDHAGFELKKAIFHFLTKRGEAVKDEGPYIYNETDDYPETIFPAVEKVTENPTEHRAIIIGGSGQGEAIVANRMKGVRAAVFYGGNIDIIKLSREHNNANVLALGARFLSSNEAQEAVQVWLRTSFSEEDRHIRRIKAIDSFGVAVE